MTLYFEVLQAVDQDDWTAFVHLVDDLGFHWGGDTFFHYPSAQWQPGQVIAFRQQLDVAPGAPPGAYTLNVGLFSPSADARLPVLEEGAGGTWHMTGTTLALGPISLNRAAAPPSSLPSIQRPQRASFDDPQVASGSVLYLGSDRDRSPSKVTLRQAS